MRDDLLWHYTSASTLLKMVTKDKDQRQDHNQRQDQNHSQDQVSVNLWATNPAYLNDEMESLWFYTLLRNAALATDLANYPDASQRAAVEALRRHALPVPEGGTPATTLAEQYATYATCFSTEGDHLGQWRAYGASQAHDIGVAVGFTPESLRAYELAELCEVQYIPDKSEGHARVREMFSVFSPEPAGSNPIGTPYNNPGGYLKWVHRDAVHNAPTVKHPSFNDEHEYRLVLRRWYDHDCLWRSSSFGVTPYLSVTLSADAVGGMRVGPSPHPDLARASLLRWARSMGLNCDVEASTSPFRYW
jgi:hypothetical protein